MNELLEQQRWLAALILDPTPLEEATAETGEEIVRRLRVRDAASGLRRLAAYTGGYPARIEESLTDAFPAVRHLAGAGRFCELARRYLPQLPEDCYNLNAIGRGFPDQLAGDPVAEDLAFLADLARLEWAVWEAFHGPQPVPFDPAPLAAWSAEQWQRARIAFQAGVRLLRSDWPVRELWEARNTPLEQIDIVLQGRSDAVLVYRQQLQVRCQSLDDRQAVALSALIDGATLGQVTGGLAAEGYSASDVGSWFAAWSERGLIARCSTDTL